MKTNIKINRDESMRIVDSENGHVREDSYDLKGKLFEDVSHLSKRGYE